MPNGPESHVYLAESGALVDMSKLPRLSKTPTAAPADPPVADPPPSPAYPLAYGYGSEARIPSGRGPEAWLSIGVGLIFLFLFPHFTQWWVHAAFHTKAVPSFLPITDSSTGAEIPYAKSDFFFNDLCIASFAYALIVEGIALVVAGRNRPGVVLFALAITTAAVVLNGWFLVSSFGEGFPLVSAIAILFGGYMIWFQWTLAKQLMAVRRFGGSPPASA